jgi:transposase
MTLAAAALPPYAPELNPVENVWEFLRGNFVSHRVWDSYEVILTTKSTRPSARTGRSDVRCQQDRSA